MPSRLSALEHPFAAPAPVLEQAHSAAHHESRGTDLVRLAETLAEPQDYDALSRDFQAGKTWLRDASGYTEHGRREVLAGRTARSDALARTATDTFMGVLHREDISGQAAAWNFLVTSETIIDANGPNAWVTNFNGLLSVSDDQSARRGIGVVMDAIADRDDKNALALQMLDGLSADPERRVIIGRFLAGRSLTFENSHRQKYGAALEQAKAADARVFLQLAYESGLAPQYIDRTLRQLRLVDVAAFDHLITGGTVLDSRGRSAGTTMADYVADTLRVGIKYGGSPGQPHLQPAGQVRRNLRHEVLHAASAQAKTSSGGGRIGLMASPGSDGWEASEAMAEYQNQIGNNFPDFQDYGDGSISYTGTYQHPVLALHVLRAREAAAFHVLFNANYGQAQARPLEGALRSYYSLLNDIRR